MAKTAVLLLFCLLSGAAGQSLNCNFENKFCNYKQDTSDTFDWVWNTKGNGGINNGPATDHTLLSPQPIKTIAGNANGANCVFPFTYNKKTYTNCININHPYKWCSTTSNYDKDKKWGNCIPKGVSSLGCFKDTWTRALPKLLIGNIRGTDRIGTCANAVKAKGWKVFAVQNTNECWSGPSAYKTYNRYGSQTTCKNGIGGGWGNDVYIFGGWYALITPPSSSSSNSDVARFVSPIVKASSSSNCLRFWYHMYGPRLDYLRVYTNSTSNSSNWNPVWEKQGTQGNQWNQASFTIALSSAYSVVFEATRGSRYKGNIAVDDITFTDGPCPVKVGICTFEQGKCGFKDDQTADFTWTRKRGGTATPGTGPLTDKTTGTRNGYYMYTEVNNQRNGAKARIMQSYLKTTANGRCLQFFYMMYGRELGTLNVYQKVGNALGKPIFTKTGDAGQGRTWLKGQATLNSSVDFMVVFEGIRGTGSRSDVAIDDVKVVEGSCGNPGDCNFQNGWCTWTNDKSPKDVFDWIIGSGGTPSFLTGPDKDRLGSSKGKYAFIETSYPRQPKDKARLSSETFVYPSSQSRCFTFWYHMYGTTIGTLNIYQTVNNKDTLIWTQTGNKGNKWYNGQVTVGKASSYKVVLEGVRGSGYTGDIAIDDFVFLDNKNCQTVPSSAAPNAPTTVATTPLITTTKPVSK